MNDYYQVYFWQSKIFNAHQVLARFLLLAASGFYQSLPFSIHGDLHVLQLMIPQHLQDGENWQADPDRQTAPSAELRSAKLDVKARCIDAISLIDVISSREFARWESFCHTLAPSHKAQSDDNRRNQGDDGENNRRDNVDECGEKRAVLAAVHEQGQSIDLYRRCHEQYQAHEYRVVAISLRRPIHDKLAVRFLPDSSRE